MAIEIKIVTAIFNPDSATANAYGLWQWDYGQVLRIQGLHLPSMVEIHFSLQDTGGTSVMRVGITKDGVTDVVIPDSMLQNNGADSDYDIFAFVYLTDDTSGQTEYKIKLRVKSRPEPEVPSGGEDPDIFHEAVRKVAEYADQAAESEKQAEGWAHGREDLPERAQDNAKYYAGQAAADAKKTGTDREEVERLVDSVSGIDEQVIKVENLTKQAQTSATNAALSEQAAKTAETNAQTAQAGAETAEGNAELAERKAKASEQAVEKAKQLVTQMGQEVLDNKNHVDQTVQAFTLTAQQAVADVNKAGQTQTEQVLSVGESAVESVKTAQGTATQAIETAKTEAVEAVQTEGTTQTGNVTAEGTKQVQAVQQAAQEIVADREQIAQNKADVTALKEDLTQKQDAIIYSLNRFDYSKVNLDKQLNTIDGSLYDAPGFKTSDYIDVTVQNDSNYINCAQTFTASVKTPFDRLVFYDSNKIMVYVYASGSGTVEPIEIPIGAKYARFSHRNISATTTYFNVGKRQGYTEYKVTKFADLIPKIEVDNKTELLKNDLIKAVASGTSTTNSNTPVTVTTENNYEYIEVTTKYNGNLSLYYRTSSGGWNTAQMLLPETVVKNGDVFKLLVDKDLIQYGFGFRAYEAGKNIDYILYNVPSKDFETVAESATDAINIAKKLENSVFVDKVVGTKENVNVTVTTAFCISDSLIFKEGIKYKLNIKDVATDSAKHFNRFSLYWKYKDGSLQHFADVSESYIKGVDFEFTVPDNFMELWGRTYVDGSKYSWIATTDTIKPSLITAFTHPLNNKTLAFYGDSITAQNNGDFLNGAVGNTWAGYFSKFVNASGYFGRGVGGQSFKWNNSCWYTEVGTNGNYKNRYKYDVSGETTNEVVSTATTEEEIALIENALGCEIEIHRGCYCSWDRITTMFPVNIKDNIDILFIMGGTNDFSSVEGLDVSGNDGSTKPIFSASNTTDSDWVTSLSYNGGDYDVTTTWGAMASTIMKFKIWMPNCKIVILTPIERAGTNYNHATNGNHATTVDLANQVLSVANWCDTEAWNMFAECGIDLFNASVMLSDGVHPNTQTGGLRMAKYLASKSVSVQTFK